jgi:phospholipid:diacylglycerol acyltransferase
MWVKGGNAVWGDATFAPDDEEEGQHTHGELISFRQLVPIPPDDKNAGTMPSAQGADKPPVSRNMTVDEAGSWILAHTPETFRVTCLSCPRVVGHLHNLENDRRELFIWH